MSNPIPPTIGRIVHYVWRNGPDGKPIHRAAMIVDLRTDIAVDLHIYFGASDGDRDGVRAGVAYSEDPKPGTWHWMPYQLGQAEKTKALEHIAKEATEHVAKVQARDQVKEAADRMPIPPSEPPTGKRK